MTPKQKAKELIEKFSKTQWFESEVDNTKECLLIAVDEIIEVVCDSCEKFDSRRYDFWQNVKEEIEKW